MIGDIDILIDMHQATLSCHSLKGTLIVFPKSQFLKIRRIPSSWFEVSVQMSLHKYRMAADDIIEADSDMVDDLNRLDFMLEKGDDWLLELFTDEREHENGVIKAYLDHDAITEHEV